MGKRQWVGLGILLGTLALVFGLSEPARSQKPPPKMTLEGRIMRYSRLKEKETNQFLQALGPAVHDLIAAGQQVEVPGLGLFRIVNVPAHRDLINGRPAMVPAVNRIEFLPNGDLADAANDRDVTPAEIVPPFQYVPIPDRVPGTKVPNTRMPNVRTR